MPPERVGRYLVYDEIAAGGMAAVHLGRLVGPAGFGRLVALKRLHPHHQKDPEFAAMLLDEARIASRIYHPNVVQVLDVVTEGGMLLVLEYVHGESLWKLARRMRQRGERLDPSIALAVVTDTLRGLHAAHETVDEHGGPLGIVHRDVSPHNILVDAEGAARLLDFGIAKAAGRITTTRDGTIKGKLSYMAPEQLRNQPLDRRVDVYAASVVLWELLTGERLIAAADDAGAIGRILLDDLASPRTIAPEVPAALDAIVMRGLARDASGRFATAGEMADALETAGTVAPRSRVAAWVAENWPDATARRERLAEIGRDRGLGVRHSAEDATASAVVVAPPVTPRASSPVPITEPVRPPRRRRSRVALLLSGTSIALVGAVLFVQRFRATTEARPGADGTISSAVVTTSSPPADPAPFEAPGPSPSASPSASAPDEPAPAATPAPRARAKPRPPAPQKRASCDPPWTLDGQGNHIWKRECFK